MKTLEKIARMGLDELEAAGADERIPVPEELAGKVAGALEGAAGAKERASSKRNVPVSGRSRTLRLAIPAAAAIALVVGVGAALLREPAPKDTFDDPYLAYAEVERAFAKISGTAAYGAAKVSETENTLDKLTDYWK